MRTKPLIALLGLLLLPQAQGAWAGSVSEPPKFVRSFSDFVDHTRAHIERVAKLGEALRTSHPDLFSDVTPELLHDFLTLHDQAKVNPTLSDPYEPALLRSLYASYHRDRNSIGKAARARLEAAIGAVNRVDGIVTQEFLRRHRLLEPDGKPGPLARKLLLLEKVADSVDRAMSPVSAEEFNKVMEPASRYLKDPEARRLAEYLEGFDSFPNGSVPKPLTRYDQIVRGSTYEEYQVRVRNRLSSAKACDKRTRMIEMLFP